jgi:hypothetical protein
MLVFPQARSTRLFAVALDEVRLRNLVEYGNSAIW